MLDWLLCVVVKSTGWLLCRLPPSVCVGMGQVMGQLAWWVQPRRARIGYLNLKAAFGERLTPGEARRMVRRIFAQLGAGVVELLRLPAVDAAYVDRYITIIGQSHVDQALQLGRPVMILTGHFGNWELCPIAGALKGYSTVALARAQHTLPNLYRLLVSYRESKGCRIIHKGGAWRQLVQALQRRELVGIVADQASRQGIFVDFFGRPALFATGPFEIARATGAVILPIFIHRTHGPSHRLVVEPPLELPTRGNHHEVVRAGIEQFVKVLARHIEDDPTQWLWLHKRWKHTPARRVLILSDGKLGHFKQSLTVLQALKERHADLREQIVEVRYRHRLARVLTLLWSWLMPGGRGGLRCLRLTLEPTCAKSLASSYADVIVSCGAATAPVNVLLSADNQSKSVVIMDPTPIPLRRFDLAFVPVHDRVPARPNVVHTYGALSTVTLEQITAAGERLRAHARFRALASARDDRPVVAVFLGGDTRDYALTTSFTDALLRQVLLACDAVDGVCLVTTSRRTPSDVERLLSDRLAKHPRCLLLLLASRDQLDGTVEGMLGRAQVVVVTGESISMISEACASGRSVIIVDPPRRGAGVSRLTKAERYVRLLVQHGYATSRFLPEVSRTIQRALTDRPAVRRLDTYATVQAAVKRLL